MFRRDFFATCVIGPLLGFTECTTLIKPHQDDWADSGRLDTILDDILADTKECIHPELGKYINHTIESHIIGMSDISNRESIYEIPKGPSNPCFKSIHFPIEVKLEIEFEYGCFNYVAFNVKVKDMIKISRMTIHEILKCKIEPGQHLSQEQFFDLRHKTDYELDYFQIGKYKFKIASICVFSKKKETACLNAVLGDVDGS